MHLTNGAYWARRALIALDWRISVPVWLRVCWMRVSFCLNALSHHVHLYSFTSWCSRSCWQASLAEENVCAHCLHACLFILELSCKKMMARFHQLSLDCMHGVSLRSYTYLHKPLFKRSRWQSTLADGNVCTRDVWPHWKQGDGVVTILTYLYNIRVRSH